MSAGERTRGAATAAAVIVAGGAGSRIGGPPKQFRPLGGRPMLAWSCARFSGHPDVDEIVAVVPSDVAETPPDWLRAPGIRLTAGGATRMASVRAGLDALGGPEPAGREPAVRDPAHSGDAAAGGGGRVVLIHDAARPFVSDGLIRRLVRKAAGGPVIPVLPVADAIKELRSRRGDDGDGEVVRTTLDRSRLRAAQTPQAFPFALIRRLHRDAERAGTRVPDDAALCERAGHEVRTVPGERWAWKITHPEDLAVAEWLVESGRVGWPGDGT